MIKFDELLVQCQNVQCGAKLMAEIHYIYKDNEKIDDIVFIEKQLVNWPEINYYISYHPDKKAAKKGHKSVIIYKYSVIIQLIVEIELLDKNSLLYHFCLGKLFGYNDHEVMKFIKKHIDDHNKGGRKNTMR